MAERVLYGSVPERDDEPGFLNFVEPLLSREKIRSCHCTTL